MCTCMIYFIPSNLQSYEEYDFMCDQLWEKEQFGTFCVHNIV